MKALNTGFAAVSWRDIEIVHGENDAPLIRLSGAARQIAEEKGIAGFAVSMSHCKEYAIAMAIGHAG
jgi:holo-[acyl-carrier protein] synthase